VKLGRGWRIRIWCPQSGIMISRVIPRYRQRKGLSLRPSSTPKTTSQMVNLLFVLITVSSQKNNLLKLAEIEKNKNIYNLLRRIHKGAIPGSKVASLETQTHKIFSTNKPSVFVKLKSCLGGRYNIKVKKRVEWVSNETDFRQIEFDVEEIKIESEEIEEEGKRKHKSRRKAESHDLNRNKDPGSDILKFGKKKNYSSKKDKLRKEIAKYFYNSDLIVPGKENMVNGQRKVKNLSKMTFKKHENMLKERNKNQFQKEKFFYKKKLKPKKR
jgi:hypothetical protein